MQKGAMRVYFPINKPDDLVSHYNMSHNTHNALVLYGQAARAIRNMGNGILADTFLDHSALA